nr:methionyl-tRNA formyltransferase [uncultured Sulfurimonas sp.]
MNKINFAFFGSTSYSKKLLEALIENDYIPSVIFSIPKEFGISYAKEKIINSNFADLSELATKYNIPYYEVDSSNGKRIQEYKQVLQELKLDLILVLGWYYMLPKEIRDLSKNGAWGIHASLLPDYAGGAPLNWAIINGEKKSGVTLFKFDEGIDSGDIIKQQAFDIAYTDSIKEVYEKAYLASKDVLLNVLKNIQNISYKPQDLKQQKIYPQRKPLDGKINLDMSSHELYNFIRAQSSPYPGAYIVTSDNKKLIIEKARIEENI